MNLSDRRIDCVWTPRTPFVHRNCSAVRTTEVRLGTQLYADQIITSSWCWKIQHQDTYEKRGKIISAFGRQNRRTHDVTHTQTRRYRYEYDTKFSTFRLILFRHSFFVSHSVTILCEKWRANANVHARTHTLTHHSYIDTTQRVHTQTHHSQYSRIAINFGHGNDT